MEKRLKRFLSLAMAVLMVVTLLPANSVLAEGDAAEGGNEPAVCTGQADCPAETHAEDCLKKQADEEAAKKQTDPPKPECNGLEDCAAETHTENCPKAVCADCEQLKSALTVTVPPWPTATAAFSCAPRRRAVLTASTMWSVLCICAILVSRNFASVVRMRMMTNMVFRRQVLFRPMLSSLYRHG